MRIKAGSLRAGDKLLALLNRRMRKLQEVSVLTVQGKMLEVTDSHGYLFRIHESQIYGLKFPGKKHGRLRIGGMWRYKHDFQCDNLNCSARFSGKQESYCSGRCRMVASRKAHWRTDHTAVLWLAKRQHDTQQDS